MSFIENLNWRYATKKFNGQVVEQKNIDTIVESIRLAPSSMGTQPYHIVVASGDVKNKLIESSKQVSKIGCSHLFVFCSRTDYPARAEKQIEIAAQLEGKTSADLAGFLNMVKGSIEKKSEDELISWAARQVYIALGFGLAACAELKIDACPMEGFSPIEFKEILKLPEYVNPFVIMAVGYRDEKDEAAPDMRHKVRFPKDDLFSFS